MKFSRGLAVAMMASMLFSASAFAQDKAEDGAVGESDKYNGGTFTIVPPGGWILVSGSLSQKEIQKLPENVREHYSMRNTDIIFMDIASPNADAKGFKNSLNIVTINEAIPLNDSLVSELSNVLKQQYEAMFEKFELETPTVTKLGSMDVLLAKGSYTILNYAINMEQYLVPSKNESLVLTCTYDSSKSNSAEAIEKCRNAVKSLVLTD